jgi:hypothetical protein
LGFEFREIRILGRAVNRRAVCGWKSPRIVTVWKRIANPFGRSWDVLPGFQGPHFAPVTWIQAKRCF